MQETDPTKQAKGMNVIFGIAIIILCIVICGMICVVADIQIPYLSVLYAPEVVPGPFHSHLLPFMHHTMAVAGMRTSDHGTNSLATTTLTAASTTNKT